MVMTGKFFADSYIAKEGNSYYLLICNSVTSKISPSLYLHIDRQKQLIKMEFDTIPFYALKVKRRWVNRVSSTTDKNPNVLFMLVYQYLNEPGIKKFYYDIWLANHNYYAKKQNRKDINKINTLKKKGVLKKRDKYVKHITSNMGIREASKMSIT